MSPRQIPVCRMSARGILSVSGTSLNRGNGRWSSLALEQKQKRSVNQEDTIIQEPLTSLTMELPSYARPTKCHLARVTTIKEQFTYVAPVKRKAKERRRIRKQLKEDDLSKLLRELQHRDARPEDYELLLLLDESVPKKHLTEAQLNSLPRVDVESLKEERRQQQTICGVVPECLCSVCQTNLIDEEGEEQECIIVSLPRCQHRFHHDCLEEWLLKSSTQCPVCRTEVLDE